MIALKKGIARAAWPLIRQAFDQFSVIAQAFCEIKFMDANQEKSKMIFQ